MFETEDAPIQELVTLEVPWVQSPGELQLGVSGEVGGGAAGAVSGELGLLRGTQVGGALGSDGGEGALGVRLVHRAGFDLAGFAGVEAPWSGAPELGVGGAVGATVDRFTVVGSGGVTGAREAWFGGALIGSARPGAVVAEGSWSADGWLGAFGVRARPTSGLELSLDAIGRPDALGAHAAVVVEFDLFEGDR